MAVCIYERVKITRMHQYHMWQRAVRPRWWWWTDQDSLIAKADHSRVLRVSTILLCTDHTLELETNLREIIRNGRLWESMLSKPPIPYYDLCVKWVSACAVKSSRTFVSSYSTDHTHPMQWAVPPFKPLELLNLLKWNGINILFRHHFQPRRRR